MPEEMMCCGTANLKHVDKDELSMSGGGKTAPRKEKKADRVTKEKKAPEVTAKTKKKPAAGKKENPYASRGLDKFSTLRAELESRREKVLRRVDGGGDRVMVRFVQSGAKGWLPIVVKLPPEEQAEPKKKCKLKSAMSPPPTEPSTPPSECASPREDVKRAAATAKATVVAAVPAKKKPAAAAGRWSSWSWGRKVRPSQYWPFVAVLLLLSLVVSGRVFAICCTSVWWYLVPILSGGEVGQSVNTGKKATDEKIVGKLTWASLPPSHGKKNSSGAHELISPRSHAHGKKG